MNANPVVSLYYLITPFYLKSLSLIREREIRAHLLGQVKGNIGLLVLEHNTSKSSQVVGGEFKVGWKVGAYTDQG